MKTDLRRDGQGPGQTRHLFTRPLRTARAFFPGAGWLPLLLAPLLVLAGPPAPAADRPNILWLTAEDISPNLGCYGDPVARTPNLDQLAARSVRYTRAFASAPVCSPARSCLLTGLYATSLNTQNLRSQFPVPVAFRGFPALLREQGYYCSNNAKTDYNCRDEAAVIRDCWDESGAKAHWRKRRPGQPFFSVFNFMHTHQSRTSVWSFEEFEQQIGRTLSPAERCSPEKVRVPLYYPDTPLVRRTLARYYDCLAAMDGEVGRILKELENDGLAEDTIVFFYGDNGAGLPRHKRVLYDSGLHEPLLIHFPAKWRRLAPAAPGQSVDRLVSFVDFAPTVLSLAGVPIPLRMQGRAFLGPLAQPPREYVFGARDRVDEAFDLVRSVRDARYLYLRNYLPHLSLNQPEGFSDQSEMRREITRLAAEGKLNAIQLGYAGPRRPLEELYDTWSDPQQIHNLASSPAHRETLLRLRQAHQSWLGETFDLGFLPESEAWHRFGDQPPWEASRAPGLYRQRAIVAAADLVGRPAAVKKQIQLLADPDSAVRYWAAVGLRAAGKDTAGIRKALRLALKDESPAVRMEAAAALAALGESFPAIEILSEGLRGDQMDVAVQAARHLQLLGPQARPALPAMREVFSRAAKPENKGDHFMFLRFCLEPAIAALE